jgi:putative addiction module component (TIGR02574 family)
MSVEAILRQVDELTPAEREQLFDRLHAKYPAVEMTPELAALLDERVAEADSDPRRYTWEEVVAYARRPR